MNLRSLSNPILNYYHNLFYPNGKKVVTKEILDKLEPLGIAVWYYDDGNYNYATNHISLATCKFDFEGNKIIKEWFKRKYSLNLIIEKTNVLRFNVIETKKFIDLIKPYVPECMNYKLGLNKKKREIKKLLQKKYNKIYCLNNKERKQKYNKEYYQRNKFRIIEKNKQYYQMLKGD